MTRPSALRATLLILLTSAFGVLAVSVVPKLFVHADGAGWQFAAAVLGVLVCGRSARAQAERYERTVLTTGTWEDPPAWEA